jgi:outer membrane usher protein FimD/PapC
VWGGQGPYKYGRATVNVDDDDDDADADENVCSSVPSPTALVYRRVGITIHKHTNLQFYFQQIIYKRSFPL